MDDRFGPDKVTTGGATHAGRFAPSLPVGPHAADTREPSRPDAPGSGRMHVSAPAQTPEHAYLTLVFSISQLVSRGQLSEEMADPMREAVETLATAVEDRDEVIDRVVGRHAAWVFSDRRRAPPGCPPPTTPLSSVHGVSTWGRTLGSFGLLVVIATMTILVMMLLAGDLVPL